MRTSDLAADVTGVHLVHHVPKRGKLVFPVRAVHTVVDGDKTNAHVGEIGVGVIADRQIIPAEAGHILHDDRADIAQLDVFHHLLKARTVEVRAGVAVVDIEAGVGEAVFFGVLFEHPFLIGDGIAVALRTVVP